MEPLAAMVFAGPFRRILLGGASIALPSTMSPHAAPGPPAASTVKRLVMWPRIASVRDTSGPRCAVVVVRSAVPD